MDPALTLTANKQATWQGTVRWIRETSEGVVTRVGMMETLEEEILAENTMERRKVKTKKSF